MRTLFIPQQCGISQTLLLTDENVRTSYSKTKKRLLDLILHLGILLKFSGHHMFACVSALRDLLEPPRIAARETIYMEIKASDLGP